MLKNTGFNHLKVGGYTGFDSSLKTKGTLISGEKPMTSECCKSEDSKVEIGPATESKKELKVETLLEKSIELGC